MVKQINCIDYQICTHTKELVLSNQLKLVPCSLNFFWYLTMCFHRLRQSDAIRKLTPEVYDFWLAIPFQECLHMPGTGVWTVYLTPTLCNAQSIGSKAIQYELLSRYDTPQVHL